MAMSKRELTAALKKMARLSSEFCEIQQKVAEHSVEVYGYEPADLDNDEFIDKCTGASGICRGMTADEFDRSMRESLSYKGLPPPLLALPTPQVGRVTKQRKG